jgi:hypothetical protein
LDNGQQYGRIEAMPLSWGHNDYADGNILVILSYKFSVPAHAPFCCRVALYWKLDFSVSKTAKGNNFETFK